MLRSKFHPALDAAVALAAGLLFAGLAGMASLAAIPPFDAAGRGAVHALTRPWLTVAMKAASLAGGGWGLWPGSVLVVGTLARAARRRDAVLFAVAMAGAEFLSESMKLFFHRPRPEPWDGYPLPPTYSFPSGHAFLSFCFFLCLAEILVRPDWPAPAKAAAWCAALACTLTVGLSRVYLGVHYPTDVIAGYAAGLVWTTAIRVAHQARERRSLPRATLTCKRRP